MDFDLSSDQQLLKDSVARVLAGRYGEFARRHAYQQQPDGFDRAVWAEYAEAGILALGVPAQFGGLEGGPVENMIVMEEFGRALAIEPYLSSAILCGAILRYGADPALKSEILPAMAEGRAIAALASVERHSRYDLTEVALAARPDATGGWILAGAKSVALGGGAADQLIVSARTSGNAGERHGITLFLVDARSAGIVRTAYPTQDGLQAADIQFRDVRVPQTRVIGTIGAGLAPLTRGIDEAIAGLCAEAVGAMDALTTMTVEYMKSRRQFGVAIGSFQALQHRAVDMLIMLEQARSMAIYAALGVATGDEVQRRTVVSAAKVQVGRAARFIGQQATQLHGGIAVTMEYQAGHYFKRLTMIEQLFGDSDHHLRLLAAAGTSAAA